MPTLNATQAVALRNLLATLSAIEANALLDVLAAHIEIIEEDAIESEDDGYAHLTDDQVTGDLFIVALRDAIAAVLDEDIFADDGDDGSIRNPGV